MPSNTPDNDPNVWPPAPHTDADGKVKPRPNSIAGWISLVSALIGALFCLVWLATDLFWLPIVAGQGLCWITALVLGIVGRRSLAGKIGLIITLAGISVLAVVLIKMVTDPSVVLIQAPSVPSH